MPLLLFSSLLFQKWKEYVQANDKKFVKKKTIAPKKNRTLQNSPKKNDLIEYKFEKMNFPKVLQQKKEKDSQMEQKSSEKGETSKENDYPNYPCTNKNEFI